MDKIQRNEYAVCLREKGLTWKQVGEKIGVSAGQAQKIVSKYKWDKFLEENNKIYNKICKEHICNCEYCEINGN